MYLGTLFITVDKLRGNHVPIEGGEYNSVISGAAKISGIVLPLKKFQIKVQYLEYLHWSWGVIHIVFFLAKD